jgi:hypothetical protein
MSRHREIFFEQVVAEAERTIGGKSSLNNCRSDFDRAVLNVIADRFRELDMRLRVVEQGTRHMLATPAGNEYRNFMLNKMHEMQIKTDPDMPESTAKLVAGPEPKNQATLINLKTEGGK